ncbi:MAG: hypothetical protein Q4D98_10045 [Planctomycetia bacterium]|nr:hypothetical protein [Planctomycetia bacterium]
MKISVLPLLTLFLVSSLLCGCASQKRDAIVALEQENAQQRERIWQSNRKMEDFRRENESLRRQIESLQSQSPSAVRSSRPAISPQPTEFRGQSNASSPSPRVTLPKVESKIPASPPGVELGTPSTDTPDWLQPEKNGATLENLNPATGNQANPPQRMVVRKTDSRAVYSVHLQESSVKAIHYEGIHVEFQMKDAQGNIVLAPAPLVVMVTDPSLPENQARISKWVYSAEEIAEIINSGQAALTIPLDMAWEKGCPENMNLEVHLLYQTSDKRLLMSRIPVHLGAYAAEENSVTAIPETATVTPQVGSAAVVPAPERPVWTPEP